MRIFQAHNLNRVNRVRFTADARTLTVAVRRHAGVVHFDPADGSNRVWDAAAGTVTDLAYSADGSVVAASDPYGVVRAYHRIEQVLGSAGVVPFRNYEVSLLAELQGGYSSLDRHFPRTLAFAPTTDLTRRRLAAAGHELLLWNPYSHEHSYADGEGDFRGAAFGPDGTTVASIEYHAHALCVWVVKPIRVLFRTDLKGIDAFDNGSVAITPDGERVIVAAGELLRCVPINGGPGWDTDTKKPPLEIALHPSGRTLLVADGSKKVTAYDTSNGKPAEQFDWGIGKVGCVTYSPDGTLAAAGGEKGQVVVWDAE